MKNLIIVSIVAFTGLLMSIQYSKQHTNRVREASTGINFAQGTLEEVKALAKKQNKIIFVDVYATWCGPCKLLKKSTFADASVGEFYNSKFVNVALDAEKGERIAFASTYKVRSYPTLLFIRPDGSIVKTVVGYHNAEEFLKLGQNIQN